MARTRLGLQYWLELLVLLWYYVTHRDISIGDHYQILVRTLNFESVT